MGTSSEDVLLMVNNVRHKKNDGTLYLMAERIAWMLENKDTFSVSHKYQDIKSQKISPVGKQNIRLQVVLHNGDSTTFHFVNPLGSEYQAKDRNDVKDMLQNILPNFQKKVNKELEEKNRMLADDPVLFQLYRDLVVSQVITADEFWANHATKNRNNQKQLYKQEVGVSAAFLSNVKQQTDGCNGVKYNISAEIIESIFKAYPEVKRKHMENVPYKMSESQFWTSFFQSHYFHRDRLNLGSKDIFSECAKHDEQDIKQAITNGIQDPLLDITSFVDSSLEEGYGNQIPNNNKQQNTNTNQSMIRRFNQHSMAIIKSCQNKSTLLHDNSVSTASPSVFATNLGTSNGLITSKALNGSQKERRETSHPDHEIVKKAKLQEKIEYEDLKDSNSQSLVSLNLTKLDRYLQGPTPVTDADYNSQEEIIQSVHHLNNEIRLWCPNLPQTLASNAAISALGELSPGGVLLKNCLKIPLKETVSSAVQDDLRHIYSSLTELLRHFWACFPTTSQQLEEKLVKMQAALVRFQQAKLQPFQERLHRDHLNLELVQHLNQMLEAAYNKYGTWHARKMSHGKNKGALFS